MPKAIFYRKTRRLLAAIFLITVVAMAVLVHYHTVLGLDLFLSRDLQSEGDTPERRTLIYHFLYLVSIFGKPVIAGSLVFLTSLLFWYKNYIREAIFVLFVPLASLINSLVKLLVNRPRPVDGLVTIYEKQLDTSFPSGHVVFYVVFFGFLLAVMWQQNTIRTVIRIAISLISLALIILISLSRVYLGAHWVSDTIGGYLLGFLLLYTLLHYYLRSRFIEIVD